MKMKHYSNSMPTRRDVLSKAADECMKEFYAYCQPSVEWEDFVQQCKDYTKKYDEWESLKREERPNIHEYCGPRPYEFYYLPREVMKEICDSYVHAYKMDNHQELVDTIQTLKNYCNEPIVDKYVEKHTDEYGNHHPGYRSYDHPDNLQKEIQKILSAKSIYWKDAIENATPSDLSEEIYNKFFSFLDMAGNFFSWNAELNSFYMTVYLGCSPNSNKEAVIENWKKYRNTDIVIDEDVYKYDDDDDEWYESDNEEEEINKED